MYFRLKIDLLENMYIWNDFFKVLTTVEINSTADTLGPAYKFGYYEHPVKMSSFFLTKENFWLTSIFRKFAYNEYRL